MDDLSNYVLEVAVRMAVDVGWRQIDPLVETARATDDPRRFIDQAIREMALRTLERSKA